MESNYFEQAEFADNPRATLLGGSAARHLRLDGWGADQRELNEGLRAFSAR
jgi:hypothetical protein